MYLNFINILSNWDKFLQTLQNLQNSIISNFQKKSRTNLFSIFEQTLNKFYQIYLKVFDEFIFAKFPSIWNRNFGDAIAIQGFIEFIYEILF